MRSLKTVLWFLVVACILAACAPTASLYARPVQAGEPAGFSTGQVQSQLEQVQREVTVAMAEGAALAKKKDYQGAASAYRRAIEILPSAPEGYLALGNAYTTLKDLDLAVQTYEQGTQSLPKTVSLWNALGQAHNARGFAMDPRCSSKHSGVGASPGTKDDKVLREQWIAKSDLDYLQAVAAFQKSLALDPNNVAAHDGLAYAYYRQWQFEQGLEWALKAVALDNKNASRYAAVANNLRRLERYPQAITWYNQALQNNPNDSGSLKYLFESYAGLKDWEGAIARLSQAVLATPKNVEAHLRLGQSFEKKGDLNNALLWYEKTLALDPKLGEAYKFAAPIYKKMGDLAKFEEYTRKAEWYKEK